MLTKTERNLECNGYKFSGAYDSYNKEKMKERAIEFRQEGYLSRVVATGGGGYCVYIKDTPKTLELKRIEEEKKEKERQELAEEIKNWLIGIANNLQNVPYNTLCGIQNDVKRRLENPNY